MGSKERYHSLVDPFLSSGDMIYSNNARPIPEMNISIPRFTTVPLTKGWLQFKGNFSVGRSFDSDYLSDRYAEKYTFVEHVLWHQKSVYFQIKDTRGDFPLSGTLGVQHIVQWGGTSTDPKIGEQPHSIKDFVRIMLGAKGGGDASLSDQINVLGSHHISFDFGLKFQAKDWSLRGYYQHLCYDKSGMEFKNGTDGLWGLELNLPTFPWLEQFVFEYVTTRNQSGPFHYIWLKGSFSPTVSYRFLLTAMNTWGTGTAPLLKKKDGISLLADIQYQHPKLKGWQFGGSIGADTGDVFGNSSTGFSLKKPGFI